MKIALSEIENRARKCIRGYVFRNGVLKLLLLILALAYIGPIIANLNNYAFASYDPIANEVDTGAYFAYAIYHMFGMIWAIVIIGLSNMILEICGVINRRDERILNMSVLLPMIFVPFIMRWPIRNAFSNVFSFNEYSLVSFSICTIIELLLSGKLLMWYTRKIQKDKNVA